MGETFLLERVRWELGEYQLQHGLTMEQLAEHSGISRYRLRRLLCGELAIRLDDVLKIANLLDLNPGELWDYPKDPEFQDFIQILKRISVNAQNIGELQMLQKEFDELTELEPRRTQHYMRLVLAQIGGDRNEK